MLIRVIFYKIGIVEKALKDRLTASFSPKIL
jgi:hypothetical protein